MIRWLTFKDLISKDRTRLIIKADPSSSEPSSSELIRKEPNETTLKVEDFEMVSTGLNDLEEEGA